jgi:hypothetical protein
MEDAKALSERRLKGFYTLDFFDENTMQPYGEHLVRTFDDETSDQTAAVNEKVAAAVAEMHRQRMFRPSLNEGAKPGVDLMMVYLYHARYTDNGQIETPVILVPKCDLDTVEADAIRTLFASL